MNGMGNRCCTRGVKIVKKLLSEKGVRVRLTRRTEVDLDLPPRVSFANKTAADIFVVFMQMPQREEEGY